MREWFLDGLAASAPVGTYKANALGLYDMLGNVWEWVEDACKPDAYTGHRRKNPLVSEGGSMKVRRGGCLGSESTDLRAAVRRAASPAGKSASVGFRVARSVAREDGDCSGEAIGS